MEATNLALSPRESLKPRSEHKAMQLTSKPNQVKRDRFPVSPLICPISGTIGRYTCFSWSHYYSNENIPLILYISHGREHIDLINQIVFFVICQVSSVLLYGVPIVALVIEGVERLCLAQISNTLLKQFSYNEIHNRRVALGITCVQCTPVQLEILRRAGAMPVSSRRCGKLCLTQSKTIVGKML